MLNKVTKVKLYYCIIMNESVESLIMTKQVFSFQFCYKAEVKFIVMASFLFTWIELCIDYRWFKNYYSIVF